MARNRCARARSAAALSPPGAAQRLATYAPAAVAAVLGPGLVRPRLRVARQRALCLAQPLARLWRRRAQAARNQARALLLQGRRQSRQKHTPAAGAAATAGDGRRARTRGALDRPRKRFTDNENREERKNGGRVRSPPRWRATRHLCCLRAGPAAAQVSTGGGYSTALAPAGCVRELHRQAGAVCRRGQRRGAQAGRGDGSAPRRRHPVRRCNPPLAGAPPPPWKAAAVLPRGRGCGCVRARGRVTAAASARASGA